MGPQLRDADVPMRYEFEDVDLVANIRAAREGRGGQPPLGVDGRRGLGPAGEDGDVLRDRQQYFQGKENIAIAIARRRIKSGGDVKAALARCRSRSPSSRATGRCRGGVPPPRGLIGTRWR